jgi:epoxyqueuosine reductase
VIALEVTDGRRVLDGPLELSAAPCAYDHAYERMRQLLGVARHEANFDGVIDRDGQVCVVFRVSRDLAAPSGYAWKKRPPLPPADPRRDVLACARVLGFPLVGVTDPVLPARYLERFDRWLESGAAAGMGFVARKAAERRDPALVLRGAQSVIALATPYSAVDASDPSARVARYAQSLDYHQAIDKRLHVLRGFIERRFGGACYLSVDTGPVLERAYAERAGIGWIGKNGVLISRTHGSYLFLATLWTTLALGQDAPHDEHCGSCEACLSGCPTQAIVEPGLVDARRCISYWTIEHAGSLGDAPPQHGWLFGCDVCQEVCPWNRFAAEPRLRELIEKRAYLGPASEWLAADDAAIEGAIASTPLRRAAPAGLRRNALRLVDEEKQGLGPAKK